MSNLGFVGAAPEASAVDTTGVVSLRQHLQLTQAGVLPQPSPVLPSLNATDITMPSNFTRSMYSFGGAVISGASGGWLDPQGRYWFTASSTGIFRYQFTDPGNWSSLKTTADQSIALGFTTTISGIFLKPDGTQIYVSDTTTDSIMAFNLSTAFDLETLTYTGIALDLNLNSAMKETASRSLWFSPDGTKIVISGSKNIWYQIDLGTAWDLTTASTYCEEKNILIGTANLYGHTFSANGDYVYLTDNTSDTVFRYSVATPWDITTIRSNQYRVEAAETGPAGAVFNADGTKFYYTGTTTDNVYELELSTPYDINTATHNSQVETYYTNRNATNAVRYSFFFKPDGTRLYLLDSSDSVIEFVLTTAYDSSTISYSATFSLSAQETDPRDLFFKPDGTKMYVIGRTGDDVNQYTLGTAWDITTATYESVFSVSGQELTPSCIEFSTDGTKMFVMGTTGDDVNEYTLSTAWDVTSASYTRVFSLTATGVVSTTPSSITFNGDGTAFYFINGAVANNGIHRYSLGTAWDLSTAAYDSSEFFATPFPSTDCRMRFNSDGTRMFFMADQSAIRDESIIGIPLTTAYNINTAQYNVGSIFDNEGTPTALTWGDSGNYLYVVGSGQDAVDQFEALVPYKASTIRYVRSFSVAAQETVPQSVAFSATGNRMIVLGSTGDDLNQYDLSTPWNISTANFIRNASLSGVFMNDTIPSGMAFSADGTKLFIVGQSTDRIYGFNCTDWRPDMLTTQASFGDPGSLDIAYYEITPTGLAINADGTSLYLVGQTVDSIHQIDLELPYLLYPKNRFYLGDKETTPFSVTFKPDGTKMYAMGTTSDSVHEYDLDTAWDISTVNNTLTPPYRPNYGVTFNQSLSVSAQETLPGEIRFKPDGTRMYVLGTTGDDINEYALSTAWNISTATFTHSFSINAQEPTPTGLFFKSDGTKMYVLGVTNDQVHQYTLATAWDVSSASYDSVSFSVLPETTNPYSLTFKSDGTKMILVDNTTKRFLSFDLDTAWDLSSISVGRIMPNTGQTYHFAMSPDGKTAYGKTNTSTTVNTLEWYELPTAYDITGAIYRDSLGMGDLNENYYAPVSGRFLLGHALTGAVRLITIANQGQHTSPVSIPYRTANFVSGLLSFSAKETVIRAFTFDSTGTRLYLAGTSSTSVHQYTLSTAWNITSATFVNSLSLQGHVITPIGMKIINDGQHLLVFCGTHHRIIKYELSTPWDITTAVVIKKSRALLLNRRSDLTEAFRILYNSAWFSFDGSQLYLCTTNNRDMVLQFSVTDSLQIRSNPSQLSWDSHALYVQDSVYVRESFVFSTDGAYLYVVAPTVNRVEQWQLSAPFVVDDSIDLVFNLDISGQETTAEGLAFSADGTRMFVVGQSSNSVHEYALSTAWQASTATHSASFSVAAQTTSARSVEFGAAGTKMFVASDTDKTIYQYTLATAWDVTSASYSSVALDINSDLVWVLNQALDTLTDCKFNADGTQLNVVVIDAGEISVIFRYDLATAWDLSTATYLDYLEYQARYETYNANRTFRNIAFSNRGRMLHLGNYSGSSFIGVELRTPYDIKTRLQPTLGFLNKVTVVDTINHYAALSENGRMLLLMGGSAYFYLTSFRLTTPFDLNTAEDHLNVMDTEASAIPTCAHWDASGQHLFYSRAGVIYKFDLSSVNT